MPTSNTLYIVGDSFSYHFRCDEYKNSPHAQTAPLWHRQVANMLGVSHLKNYSVAGVSQDYIFDQLKKEVFPNITKEDYVIVVTTQKSRFWFIQDNPDLTNFSTFLGRGTLGISDYIESKEKQDAILGYVSQIQRDELDDLWNEWRFGWLSYQIKNLRTPLILQGFYNDNIEQKWGDLSFSIGNLADVQNKECYETDAFTLWKGQDLRYNHLCLSNHNILARKIYNFFTQDDPVNLNLGFYKNIIKKYTWNTPEFAMKELNIQAVDKYNARNTK